MANHTDRRKSSAKDIVLELNRQFLPKTISLFKRQPGQVDCFNLPGFSFYFLAPHIYPKTASGNNRLFFFPPCQTSWHHMESFSEALSEISPYSSSRFSGEEAKFFFLFFTHSVRRYSIWPLIERKSSSAQAANSCHSAGERRSNSCFLAFSFLFCPSLAWAPD